MRRLHYSLVILLLGMMLPPASAQDAATIDLLLTPWQGAYYSNDELDGDATLTRDDGGIGFEWGNGAPAAGLPPDGFSVTWEKGGQLPAGVYRFIVTATGGFRVWVDGGVKIDAWDGGASGVTVGRDVPLEAGFHTLRIDFRDDGGPALIYLDWGPAPGFAQPPAEVQAKEDTITVIASRLNVRQLPGLSAQILGIVRGGEQYTVRQLSADGNWVRIDSGWVYAAWVSFDNAVNDPPFAPLAGLSLRANMRVNMRSAPGINNELVGVLARNEVASIIGRDAPIYWYQINVDGRIGWVSARLVTLSPDVIPVNIRITG